MWMKIEDKAVNADCCHKSPYIRTHQNLSKMHSVSGFSPRNLLMHMWHTFLNCINGLAYASEFRSTYLYTSRVWPWKKISFAWVSKWPKCHNLLSYRTKRTYVLSFFFDAFDTRHSNIVFITCCCFVIVILRDYPWRSVRAVQYRLRGGCS